MRRRSWTASRTFAVCALLALSGASERGAEAAFAPERASTSGSRKYANARVVSIDAQAGTITVRGGGVGKDETFSAEAQALKSVGTLKPGEQVVLTLRTGGAGPEVVTQIERSVAGAGKRRFTPKGKAAPGPAPTAPPTANPTPSAEPGRLPTDTVGPLRDPRRDPNADPRQNPLRDPRVVPGLSQPVPTPTPSPTPPATGG